MKPLLARAEDFITLEGTDYSVIRRAEALARESYSRPENADVRRRNFEFLLAGRKGQTVSLAEPEESPPPALR